MPEKSDVVNEETIVAAEADDAPKSGLVLKE